MIQSEELLKKLTGPQREAVTHVEGPLLILAGPGSGKTRVITHRVAYLISQGVPAWHILAITFTNKAAEEMRQRIERFNLPRGATLSTFHALAARLLREFHAQAGLPRNFSIYDEPDQKAAMREALKALNIDPQNFPPGKMLGRISDLKNSLQGPESLGENKDFYNQTLAKIYKAYDNVLRKNGALDFDDLLVKLAYLLRDNPEVRDRLNDRYRYVLVDEYQDTNQCQYQIAKGLSLNHHNLCVTGDPDQSIYGWRGADIGNILAFEKDYPDARTIKLEENFRSTPQVLALADELIAQNQRRKAKRLFTSLPAGTPAECYEFQDEYQEAAGMAAWIEALRQENFEYRDIAVFYRVNSMSRVLEEVLISRKIPYQIVRGLEFFERKEVKDMLAYLRLLVNPGDEMAFKRIINVPTRGIGATTVSRLVEYAANTAQGISAVIANPAQVPQLNAGAQAKVKKFAEMMTGFRAWLGSQESRVAGHESRGEEEVPDFGLGIADCGVNSPGRRLTSPGAGEPTSENRGQDARDTEEATNPQSAIRNPQSVSVDQIMRGVFEQSGLKKELETGEKGEERLQNVEELINSAVEYAKETDQPSLDDYLQQVALFSDADAYDEAAGTVSLMSLHAAKGLEFPAVMIIGVEENLIPHTRSLGTNDQIEEERRLLFVGMTRAQKRLLLSFARNRTINGLTMATIRSPFIRGLEHLEFKQATGGRWGGRSWDEDREDDDLDLEERTAGGSKPAGKGFERLSSYDATEQGLGLKRGQRVRHPTLGVGRIIEITPARENSKAVVQFINGSRKTLVLKYAHLEAMD